MKMQKVQKGFTLIELMIVIAIVGILAAIALPAYQDYTVRARMAEPMAALAEARTSVTEFYSANNYLPDDNADAGILQTRTNSLIIDEIIYESVTGVGPRLTASVLQSVIPGATESLSFELSGTSNADGTITWKCQPSATTPVDGKYLAATCR